MTCLDGATAEVIACGLRLLRAGQFYEAHECFEDAWRRARDSERTRMQTLAQLSAAYHQLSLGRARAAVRTWRKARDKLAGIDALSSDYQRRVEEFWTLLGVTSETPRFIRVEDLPPPEHWPRPEYLLHERLPP